MPVRFALLGPLEVTDERGMPRTVTGGRQRALLATLLLNANRPVPSDLMIEAVWDGRLVANPTNAARSAVRRLRTALGPGPGARITACSPGYAIEVREAELDVTQFEAWRRQCEAAIRAERWRQATDLAGRALRLWRGPPLLDVPSSLLKDRFVPGLQLMRSELLEQRNEADLHLGRHAQILSALRELVSQEPLRERFHAQLMLVLFRCGRQAEALAAYRAARRVLIDELGIEPGAELRELHARILAGDPSLAAPARGAAGLPALVPHELPARVRHFIGRGRELAFLKGQLEQGRNGQPTLVISAIGGAAGVGKTALAVAWAHEVAELFPGGQLYVNLRGYDLERPLATAYALTGFLRALGVPGTDIPDGLDERARLYRSRLAGRRILVVLDNARDADHVRPLLPGDPGCATVITSRDSLTGLVARDGAQRLDLDLLPLADAIRLLRSLIGARVDEDPGAAAALADQCARLPLALRLAAELAAERRSAPLRDLVTELTESRLDCLDAGEDRADVRAVFSWSFRQLPDDAAGAFALLGLHPGADLDVHAAAALTGISIGQARHVLGQLLRASLLQAADPGRYGMHDLLRAYAREQAAARDNDGRCRQALTRLFDYYLSAAAAAMQILYPAEAHQRPRITPTAAAVPEMPDQASARAWLDRERPSLVAVVVHCADHGWPQHVTSLAGTLFRYLITGSHLAEAHTMYSHTVRAARQCGDPAAEARAESALGSIAGSRGRFRDAADHYQAALKQHRQRGDRAGQAAVFYNLGVTEHYLHNFRPAADYYREAAAAFRDTGDHLHTAAALCTLSGVEIELEYYEQAAEHLQQALPVFRAEKDQAREAEALTRMGDLGVRRGQLTEAADFYEQSLAIYRRTDNPVGIADAVRSLGIVCLRQRDHEQAVGHLRQAVGLFRQTGNQFGEITTLRSLAEALHEAGQPAAARSELTAALGLATETGNTYQQATAHRDLAESHHAAGEDELARDHWQQALTLYTQLGAPEADEIRNQLPALQADVNSAHATSGDGRAD
jgi:DNA-binding SARP family transcriptional activator